MTYCHLNGVGTHFDLTKEKRKIMTKELTQEEFSNLVKLFNLTSTYSWISHNDIVLIVETWQSESNPFIKMTKTFEFNEEKLSSIPEKKRSKLLKKMLKEAVEVENYEFAAKLRDLINV